MSRKRLTVKELEVRNKWILVGILILIGFLIYTLIQLSIAAYEEQMKDNKISVRSTYQEALKIQTKNHAVVSNGIKWSKAKSTDINRFMKPEPLYHHSIHRYQFLNLKMSQKINHRTLNELLVGKGILEGFGPAFERASKQEKINEIYLISHAMLETGKGTSELARGVKLNDKGHLDSKGKTYYNFFGIGAYDKNPVIDGARFAQKEGWDTPEKAVLGGAKFIKNEFLGVNQDTLYAMRWNPERPGDHQYATDVMWAHHNARQIAAFYQKLGMKGQFFTRYYYKK